MREHNNYVTPHPSGQDENDYYKQAIQKNESPQCSSLYICRYHYNRVCVCVAFFALSFHLIYAFWVSIFGHLIPIYFSPCRAASYVVPSHRLFRYRVKNERSVQLNRAKKIVKFKAIVIAEFKMASRNPLEIKNRSWREAIMAAALYDHSDCEAIVHAFVFRPVCCRTKICVIYIKLYGKRAR